jgi:hypothetical protein
MQPLKLFWARGSGGDGRLRNAGDWYSPVICEYLSRRKVVYAPPEQCDLAAAGSLLQRLNRSHRLHRLGIRRGLHIWGTGSLRPEDRLEGRHTYHALRGELSRRRASGAADGIPLGDPGLLADVLMDAPPVKSGDIGVIPHVVDRNDADLCAFVLKHPSVTVLDITAPVQQLLQSIAATERVLSSSLHGLIFADALGIPNTWLTLSDRLIGGRHKFDDYYSAFGLSVDPVRLQDLAADDIGGNYHRPGIDQIKSTLAAAFPFRA